MPINNYPLVSVIIPNYNHAIFLKERIESVLNQSYLNFEIIILDDVSTDNSKEIIMLYENNPHVSHIVFNEENSGSPFKQWKKGMELAKGELIWIAESDDSCEVTLLEKLVKEHLNNGNVVTFCKSQRMDENGFKYETFHNEIKYGNWRGKDFIQQYLGKYNIIMNASSAIFDKKTALQVDTHYMRFKGSGDWLFWIEMVKNGSISYIDEALNFFRKHSTNTTEKSYSNGTNFVEDKIIFDYLVGNQLISQKTSERIRMQNLYKFSSFPFDNEEVRYRVINAWHFTFKEQLRKKMTSLFNRIRRLI